MALELLTYKTQVVLANGPFVGRENAIGTASQPAGYVPGLPQTIWGADSFEWQLDVYEWTGEKLDMSSATATLYIAPNTSGVSLTAIGTGVISGTGDYIVTFGVDAGAIPAACYGLACVVVAAITAADKQTSIVQYLNVAHHEAGTGAAPIASAIAYTPAVSADWVAPVPDDVAEALDDMASRVDDVQTDAEAASSIGITYSSNDPSIVPDGAITIADGSTPTVAELLEFCEELNAALEALRVAVSQE